MSDMRGQAATELFCERSGNKNCKNNDLREALCQETVRPGMGNSPEDTTVDNLSRFLPTIESLREFIRKNATDLWCRCKLCGNVGGVENQPFLTSNLTDDEIKAICILIFSGCLFALNFLYKNTPNGLLSTLSSDAAPYEPLPASIISRFRSERDNSCDHAYSRPDEDYAAYEKSREWRVCDDCLGIAFKSATISWAKLFDIPTLNKTSTILNYSNRNLPFILQGKMGQGQSRTKLNPSFYSSKIKPGYCRLGISESHSLFRKVYKYEDTDSEAKRIREATREAEIGLKLAQYHHRSISHTLFAFQRTDEEYQYIELVFPLYQGDLSSVLSQSRPPINPSSQPSPLDQPLWEAMMNVFEALLVMHNSISNGRLGCSGHFDIKPSNILVQRTQSRHHVNLLLGDFGQAAANRAGTNDYAPPERHTERNHPQRYLSFSYDIWSMACMLIQVLVFLAQGSGERNSFDTNRHNQVDAAFWQFDDDETPVLRPQVETRLNKLLEIVRDPRIENIVATLRKMLSIDPAQRPTTSMCLARLKCPRDQELIKSKLNTWTTHYSTHPTTQIPAKLYLYRDRPSKIRDGNVEELTLDIQGVSCQTKSVQSVSFVPIAFFDSDSNNRTFPCRFEGIHKETTFRFTYLDEFLKFIQLITYQRIVPVIPNDHRSETEILFSSCSVKKSDSLKHSLLGRAIQFGKGRLQVWNQSSQERYRQDLAHSRAGGGIPIKHKENVWKLALWTTDKAEQRVCIVVDIGSLVWKIETPQGNQRLLILRQLPGRNFRGAVLEPPGGKGDDKDSQDKYPGFPISPGLILTKLGIQLKSVEIEFKTAEGTFM